MILLNINQNSIVHRMKMYKTITADNKTTIEPNI